ncbi:MAG: hypothetical protein ACREO3_05215 [Arenimonas sp.]
MDRHDLLASTDAHHDLRNGTDGAHAVGSGNGAADLLNPSLEEAYWRDNYADEAYVRPDFKFDDYAPAYRIGYLGATRREGRSFEEAEPQLREQYERVRNGSPLHWDAARVPAQAAWERVAAREHRNH